GTPLEIYVCHCTECRKQSASAFGISVIVNSADVRLNKGELKRWSRPTDSGGQVDCYFCPQCGSRVWHGDRDKDQTLSVKGGSLDQPVDLGTAVHIWTSRTQSGVVIPDHADKFPHEPDSV
ncbi:MAG: GFA family protein, partial [Aestuariivirgaceae bacterium]